MCARHVPSFVPEEDPWFRQSGVDKFATPRTCVWLDGCFYCVLDRALIFFDLASMSWRKLHSSLRHEGINQHKCIDRMQVRLPPDLVHFFCLWERNGELMVAGSIKMKDSKFVTGLWSLAPSLQLATSMARVHGSVLFAWEHVGHIPSHILEGEGALCRPGVFEGKQRFARGDAVCVSTIDDADLEDYKRHGPAKGPYGECQLQFYVHGIAKKSFEYAESIPITTVFIDLIFPANLAIHPCPFTIP